MDHLPDAAADFAARREREARREFARRPKRIGDVLAALITARGYGRVEGNRALEAAWLAAAGARLGRYSRAGRLRRGRLEVLAANSTIIQELSFQKREILARLQERLPDGGIRDIRFRIGAIK